MPKSTRKKRLRPVIKKKPGKRISFSLILFICFTAFFLYRIIHFEILDKSLARDGIVTRGYIYKVSRYGKGTHTRYYRFYYPNSHFERTGEVYNSMNPEDSITVIFLPDNPDKNRSWRIIKTRRKAKERIRRGELPDWDD